MTNLTLSVPDDLYEEMKKHPEIRWSEVARQALAKKLDDLRRLDALLSGSKLTDEDGENVAKSVKEGAWKKHRKRRTGPRAWPLRPVVDATIRTAALLRDST